MSDFFEELGKRITEVATDLGKLTEDTIEIQKVKSEIRSRKRDKERELMEIGVKVFDKFKKGEVADTELIPLCESLEKRDEEIEDLEEKITRIKEGI